MVQLKRFFRFLCSVVLMTSASAAIQYCHKDELVNFCAGLVTAKNMTSGGTDLYVTLGFEGVASTGWMAMGLGEQMSGSLFFLLISDQKKNAIMSVRTTEGHFQPHLQPDKTPAGNLLAINSQSETWQEYAFVCYSCDAWSSFNPDEKSHPVIWAAGLNQKFEQVALDSRIHQHDHYGLFWADMSAATGPSAAPPALDRSKGSFGASDFGSPSGSSETPDAGFTAARAHGLLLALAFMVLFPSGTVILRTGYGKAFQAHVALQAAATACALIGIVLIAWPIVVNDGLERLLQGHPIFGTIIAILVAVQIWLGWWHHRNFVKLRRRTAPSFIHMWNGRLLLILGAVNTAFGIVFAKERVPAKLIWGVLAAIEAIILLIVVPELVRRKQQYENLNMEKLVVEERGHLLEDDAAQ